MTAKADIRNRAKNRVVTSTTLTDSMIDEYVEDSHCNIENMTGITFDTSDIPSAYESVLVDMTVLEIVNYLMVTTIKKTSSIGGEQNVDYGNILSSLKDIARRLEKRVNVTIGFIGLRREFTRTSPI